MMKLILPAFLIAVSAWAVPADNIQSFAARYTSAARDWQQQSEQRELLACGPSGDLQRRAEKLNLLQRRMDDSQKFINGLSSGLQTVLYAPMSAAGVDACSAAFNRVIDGLSRRGIAIERSKALVLARKRDLEKEKEEFRLQFAAQATVQSQACAKYANIVERMRQEYETAGRSLDEMADYLEVNRQAFGDSVEENRVAKSNCGGAR